MLTTICDNILKLLLNTCLAVLLFSTTWLQPNAAYAQNLDAVPQTLTPLWVDQQIKAHEAKFVVRQLWEQRRYDDLLREIDSGKSDWIALAPKLAQGTDAGSSVGLEISLAFALPINPAAVLAVMDPSVRTLSPETICSAPFIEDTQKDIPGYLRRSIEAVQRVNDSKLERQKMSCLTVLNTTAKGLHTGNR